MFDQGGPFGLDSNWKPILIGLDWQLVGQRSRFLWLPIGKLDANWPNAVQLAKLANWMPIGRQRPIRPIEHFLMIKTYKKWKKQLKIARNSGREFFQPPQFFGRVRAIVCS